MRFNKLEVPYQWKDYFTKYPHGFTIWEALCSWTKQVDDMVDSQNNWLNYLDNFVETFEFELKEEVTSTLQAWQADGQLETIITDALTTGLNQLRDDLDHKVMRDKEYMVSVKDFGAIGDGQHDDTVSVKNALDSLDEGDTLFFPLGTYKLVESLTIDKYMQIKGKSLGKTIGTKLDFYGCTGLKIKQNNVKISQLSIRGFNKPTTDTVSLQNKIYGTVGVDLTADEGYTPSAVIFNDCNISNFNVGVLFNSILTPIPWAGAYRSFTNCVITYNDVGVVARNGATYEKFSGGMISKNTLHAVHSLTDAYYNHLSFDGVAFENNGSTRPFYDSNPPPGIYSGKKSKLFFTNCYFETNSIYADTGGTNFIGTSHIHENVPIFGRGSTATVGSISNYQVKASAYDDFVDDLTFPNGGTAVATRSDGKEFIYTSSLSDPRIYFPDMRIYIGAKDFKGVKLSFSYKLLGGITAPGFGISPLIRMYTDNSLAGSNNVLVYPVDPMRPNKTLGESQYIEFYFHPRFGDGYLDETENIHKISASITMRSRDAETVDYSNDELKIQISSPTVTVFTDADA